MVCLEIHKLYSKSFLAIECDEVPPPSVSAWKPADTSRTIIQRLLSTFRSILSEQTTDRSVEIRGMHYVFLFSRRILWVCLIHTSVLLRSTLSRCMSNSVHPWIESLSLQASRRTLLVMVHLFYLVQLRTSIYILPIKCFFKTTTWEQFCFNT